MKRNNLLKVLGITFFVVVFLTWIIPAGNFSSGEYLKTTTEPLGFFDLARTPLIAVANLIQYGILFALIGGLYGVLEKTGAYLPMVDKIIKKWKGKERVLLAILTVLFTLVSAVTGLDLLLLVLTPFIASIVIGLGCDKISAMLVTIGSIIIGKIGSVYSSSVTFNSVQYLGIKASDEILTRIIICLIVTVLYTLFIVGRNKKQKVVNEIVKEEVVSKKTPAKKAVVKKESAKKASVKKTSTAKKTNTTKKTTTSKSSSSKKTSTTKKTTKACAKTANTIVVKNNSKKVLPLVLISLLVLIVIFVAMYNWEIAFNTTFFTDLYTSVLEIEVFDFPIVANLIGSITPFGNWGIYDLIIFIALATFVIGWLYAVKLDDIIDGFVDGVKKFLPAASLAVFANIIYAAMYSSSTGSNILFTITDWILGLTKGFNVATMSLLAGVGSFFINDYQALVGTLSSPISLSYTDSNVYSFIAIIFQCMYGLVMMIAPTSVLLIGGLSLFEISFCEWIKNIWKFLLKLFVVIVIIFIIIAMFI